MSVPIVLLSTVDMVTIIIGSRNETDRTNYERIDNQQ